MRYFETILKLAFVLNLLIIFLNKIYLKSGQLGISTLITFVIICLTLGFVLILNKKKSYGGCSPKNLIIRRIGGIILLIMAIGATVPLIWIFLLASSWN